MRFRITFPVIIRLCLLLLLTLAFVKVRSDTKSGNALVAQNPKIPVLPLNPSKDLVNYCSRYTIDRLQGYLDLKFLKCLDSNLNDEKAHDDANLICEKSIYKDETDLKLIYQVCLEVEVFEDNYSCHKNRIENGTAQILTDNENIN